MAQRLDRLGRGLSLTILARQISLETMGHTAPETVQVIERRLFDHITGKRPIDAEKWRETIERRERRLARLNELRTRKSE